jgi:hypothetical protein
VSIKGEILTDIPEFTAREILDAMLVPYHSRTFALGCFERKITIHAQQTRALNLVFALFKDKKLTEKSDICIIGGGISAIMAAAALVSKGCTVKLFEKAGALCPVQRGDNNRFLHPGIYDWPLSHSMDNETDFPFLNWKADISKNVIRQLIDGYKKFRTGVDEYLEVEVKEVIEKTDHVHVILKRDYNNKFRFDYVIYAGGFGEEKDELGMETNSYWRCECLHQELLGTAKKTPKAMLAGTGDGGLIDCLRAIIADFDQGDCINMILNHPEFTQIGERLIELEKPIAALSDVNEQSLKLYELYDNNLKISNELMELFSENTRKDITEVVLYGKTPTPLSMNTSRLNRLLIYILHFKTLFIYRQETLTKKQAKTFSKQGYNVIERSGTIPYWVSFFKQSPEFETELEKKRQLLQKVKPGERRYWTLEHDFYRAINIRKEEKRIALIAIADHSYCYSIYGNLQFALSKERSDMNITFEKPLGIDPKRSNDRVNRSSISNYILKTRPHAVIFLHADLLKYKDAVDDKIPLILIGEQEIVHDHWKDRKMQFPEECVIGLSHVVELEEFLTVLSKIFPGGKIGYVYDSEYDMDTKFLKIIEKMIAEHPTWFGKIKITGIDRSLVNSDDDLEDCDIYTGRTYMHCNHSYFFSKKPFATGFAGDTDERSLLMLSSSALYMSKQLLLILSRVINVRGKPSKDYYSSRKPQLSIDKKVAKDFSIELPEEFT